MIYTYILENIDKNFIIFIKKVIKIFTHFAHKLKYKNLTFDSYKMSAKNIL